MNENTNEIREKERGLLDAIFPSLEYVFKEPHRRDANTIIWRQELVVSDSGY